MTDPILWFANRGTGVVLLVLLTLSTVLGVLSGARMTNRIWPRMLSQGLHRNVSLLAVALLAAHAVTAVVDSFVDIRWWHAFVPFAGTYKTVWLGFGALAFDLLLAVTLTSMFRHRMSHRPWRAVHLLAYAAWGLGLFHGMQMGTDAVTVWGTAVNISCLGVVAVAVVARVGMFARSTVATS